MSGDTTTILLIAAAVAVYLFTRQSPSASTASSSMATGSTATPSAQAQAAALYQQAAALNPTNPSASAELTYAAADILQPYSITGATVHQTTALIGLEGVRKGWSV